MKGFNRIQFCALGLAAVAALMLGAGCGGDSTKPKAFDPPGNVTVINGNAKVDLSWSASPQEGGSEFQQYNIYRRETSLAGIEGSALANYKVASVGKGDHTYTDQVANGSAYYYQVRSQKTDGSLSGASNEVRGAGRIEGTGIIIEEFVSSGDSGFDFSAGHTVSLREDNTNRFTDTDMYLGTTAEDDADTSPLALKSPELLANHGDATWSSKNSDIKSIGTDFDITTTETPGAGWSNFQQVAEGNVYAIKTPSDNYAKIKILDITGQPGSRAITFKYAYQPTPNLVLF